MKIHESPTIRYYEIINDELNRLYTTLSVTSYVLEGNKETIIAVWDDASHHFQIRLSEDNKQELIKILAEL
jgi:hypothetical protein